MSRTDELNASTDSLRGKWDARYRDVRCLPEPALVLTENRHLLPAGGDALDLASGLGANALLMARHGLRVRAWDLSPVAVERLNAAAQQAGAALIAEVRDVEAQPPEPDRFDVIVVAHFLTREIAPAIAAALRPGGLLFYQTFAREAVTDSGPSNPVYRLATNELLALFPGLILRFYREEGRVGDCDSGTRDLAQMVAQRPS